MNDGNPTADGPVLRIEDHRPEAIRIAHQAAELERLNRLQAEDNQPKVSAEQGTSVVIAAASMSAGQTSPRTEHGAIISSLHESDSSPDPSRPDAAQNPEQHDTPDLAQPTANAKKPAVDEAVSNEIASETNAEDSKPSGADDTTEDSPTEDAAAELANEQPEQGGAAADRDEARIAEETASSVAADEFDSTDEPIADEAAAPHLDEICAADEAAEPTDAPELDSASVAAEAQPEAATCKAVDESSREPSADARQQEEPNTTEATDEVSGPRLADLDKAEQPSAALEKPLERTEQTATPEQAEACEDEDSLAAKAAAAAKIAEEEIGAKGLAFIEQIEKKHNQVLDELDALNARIESVLESYLSSRDGGDKSSQEDEKKAA